MSKSVLVSAIMRSGGADSERCCRRALAAVTIASPRSAGKVLVLMAWACTRSVRGATETGISDAYPNVKMQVCSLPCMHTHCDAVAPTWTRCT